MIDEEEGFSGIWLKPVDARRYAWTRLAFAAVIVCQMVHLWPYREGLFGNGGLFPEEVARAYNPGVHLPAILMVDVSWWPGFIIATGFVAALLLFWGKWARASLVVVFLVLLVGIQRAPLATTGWDFILTNFSFILIFSPLATEWTPARLWISRKTARLGRLETGMLPRYGLVLLQIQVAIIYWETVLGRAGDKFWGNGEFLSYYFLSLHSRFAGPWVLEWEGVLSAATFLTSFVEIAIPILLWIKATRWIGLATGVVFHMGIAAVSLNIGLFSITILMTYVSFLGGVPDAEWDDD
jgi:hypothetical protein